MPALSKTCSQCSAVKSLDDYCVRRASADGRSLICRSCNAAKGREWRAANPGKNTASVRAWKHRNATAVRESEQRRRKAKPEVFAAIMRKHTYGLNDADYKGMLRTQDNRCAICRVEFPVGAKRIDKPQVDHNHVSGKVRGLLCTGCNHGLGRFRDNPVTLEAAANYLRRSP